MKKQLFGSLAACCFALTLVVAYEVVQLAHLKLVKIDAQLKEVSGLEFDKQNRLWAINDSGDEPILYWVKEDGTVGRTIQIQNAKNHDWEDMTQDDFGHFFIGDFGNNAKDRRWLTIYKIENPIDIKGDTTQAEIIKFTYADVLNTAPGAKEDNYDLEAFVYFKRQLYLFTKNRDVPFDGKTHLHRIGDHAANYKAQYVSSFTTCTGLQELCWITSAAMSPDRSKLVLLDSERLWLFENWQDDDFFSGDVYKIKLGIVTQKEGVTFFDNNTVVFTDEEFQGFGRNAYVVKLDESRKIKVRAASKDVR